jgi:hypothetical protein
MEADEYSKIKSDDLAELCALEPELQRSADELQRVRTVVEDDGMEAERHLVGSIDMHNGALGARRECGARARPMRADLVAATYDDDVLAQWTEGVLAPEVAHGAFRKQLREFSILLALSDVLSRLQVLVAEWTKQEPGTSQRQGAQQKAIWMATAAATCSPTTRRPVPGPGKSASWTAASTRVWGAGPPGGPRWQPPSMTTT